jgi:hypothetical protein
MKQHGRSTGLVVKELRCEGAPKHICMRERLAGIAV